MDRRMYLATLGMVSTAPLAGCNTVNDDDQIHTPATDRTTTTQTTKDTEKSVPENLRAAYDQVVDVRDYGADPSGQERIDDVIAAAAADNTLLWFPSGEYAIGSVEFESPTDIALYGPNATLVLDEPGKNIFLRFAAASGVLIEGFTVDASAPNTSSWIDLRCVDGKNIVTNIDIVGFGDVSAPTYGFTLLAEGSKTALTLDSVNMSDGAVNGLAMFVFPQHYYSDHSLQPGSLTFRNCIVQGWGREGLYASSHGGPLRIIGGEYANNAIAQVRIGGGNGNTRAYVRDVTVRIDGIPDYFRQNKRFLRGIWLKEGDRAVVDDCKVVVHNVTAKETDGAIVIKDQFGRATIRNTKIYSNVPTPDIWIADTANSYNMNTMPGLSRLPDSWQVTCQDLTIESEGSGPTVMATGRDVCVFNGLTIKRRGNAADGLHLKDVGSCHLEGVSVDVERFPVVVDWSGNRDNCIVSLDETTTLTTSRPIRDFFPVETTRLIQASATTADEIQPYSPATCVDPTAIHSSMDIAPDGSVLVFVRNGDGRLQGQSYRESKLSELGVIN